MANTIVQKARDALSGHVAHNIMVQADYNNYHSVHRNGLLCAT